MNTSRDIIEVLGGHEAVALALGKKWKTVANWTRTGRRISAASWPSVARLPQAVRHNITVDKLATLPANPSPGAA